MNRQLPPLDLHAHIDVGIPPRDLERLGAVVFAATRSIEEFEGTLERSDLVTVWGVGCHPGVAAAQRDFDGQRFAAALARTPYISEVGLDGSSRVPMARQQETFQYVLSRAAGTPRIVSVHSARATGRVLDLIADAGAPGIVLHWWLGSVQETLRALDLGCMFSINASVDLAVLRDAGVPVTALLPETDHPSGNRRGSGPHQPGWTQDVEQAVADTFGLTTAEVRAVFWANLARLVSSLRIAELFPPPVRAMLRSAAHETSGIPGWTPSEHRDTFRGSLEPEGRESNG